MLQGGTAWDHYQLSSSWSPGFLLACGFTRASTACSSRFLQKAWWTWAMGSAEEEARSTHVTQELIVSLQQKQDVEENPRKGDALEIPEVPHSAAATMGRAGPAS